MSKNKTLAIRVAKILMFVLLVYCPSRGQTSIPTPTPTPVQKTSSSWAVHQKFHKGKNWWNWIGFDNIFMSKVPPAFSPKGEMEYFSLNTKKPGEKILFLDWDANTQFFVKEVGGLEKKCYFVVYCRIHHLALFVEEQTCPTGPKV
jgi:hypothetical protein